MQKIDTKRLTFSTLKAIAIVCTLSTLAACASLQEPTPQAAVVTPAPKLEPLSELMQKADALAASEGGKEAARVAYRAAAKFYPTSKQPWLKLGESYFGSSDYGNAILACQEVIERDPTDKVALGLLAVSGLRVSSKALATLRTDDTALSGDVRSEARNLVTQLRDVVKQSELVPPAVAVIPTPADKPRAPAVAAKPKPAASATAATSAASAPTKDVKKPTTSSGNPFDKLK
jgi:tetratricopeptide (TPR) repeat protein